MMWNQTHRYIGTVTNGKFQPIEQRSTPAPVQKTDELPTADEVWLRVAKKRLAAVERKMREEIS